MAFLPVVGVTTYNGFTFNSATKTRVAARPVYDEANRTIVAVVYSITIVTYIAESVPGAGADLDVADLRQRLLSPGRSFTFTGQGFGALQINVAGVKDVMWGPKPTFLDLEPVGSKSLWRVVWSVDVAIPECTTAQYANTPMAFNYQTTFAIDADGYTQRTMSGYLEIPMTRAFDGARNVPDSADKYRERIKIPIPEGFRRVGQTFNVSTDKRRLDFSFIDEEIPSEGMPEGCTFADGIHMISSAQAGTTRTWTGRIAATYIVPKGKSRDAAYAAFFALVNDRLDATRRETERNKDTKGSVIPYSLEITHGLYLGSRRISFSMGYTFLLPLKEIVKGAGLMREVPNTGGRKWATSIEEITGVRGYANMRDDPSQEIIIDLCGGTAPGLAPTPSYPVEIKPDPKPNTKQGGYIAFQQSIDIEEHPGWVTMRTLPKQKSPELRESLGSGSFSSSPGSTFPTPGPSIGDPPTVAPSVAGTQLAYNLVTGVDPGIAHTPFSQYSPPSPPDMPANQPGPPGGEVAQMRTVPTYTVRLRGYAVSLGMPIDCPSLDKFEDAKLIPDPLEKPRFTVRTLGYLLNMPLVHAEWVIAYRAIYPNGWRKAQ